MATSDAEKATILNAQFSSVLTDDNHNLPVFGDRTCGAQFGDLKITPEHVRWVLCKLRPKFGPTPDGLPTAVLKQLSFQLAVPLAALFQSCIDTESIPAAWKLAHISAVLRRETRVSQETIDQFR